MTPETVQIAHRLLELQRLMGGQKELAEAMFNEMALTGNRSVIISITVQEETKDQPPRTFVLSPAKSRTLLEMILADLGDQLRFVQDELHSYGIQEQKRDDE